MGHLKEVTAEARYSWKMREGVYTSPQAIGRKHTRLVLTGGKANVLCVQKQSSHNSTLASSPPWAKVSAEEVQGQGKGSEAAEAAAAAQQVAVETLKPSSKLNFPWLTALQQTAYSLRTGCCYSLQT